MSTKTSKRRKNKGMKGMGKAVAVIGLGALTVFQPETFIVTVPAIIGILK